MKRRDFLKAAAILAGSTGISYGNSKSEKHGLRLGLTTYMIGGKWTLDELLANLERTKIFDLELRTDLKYAHGVELTLGKKERMAVRNRIANSPVNLIGIACSERFDHPEQSKVDEAVEKTKRYLELCSDLGATGLRVFPNSFHKGIPQEKTIEQIITALRRLTQTADDLNETLCLEAHGSVGRLPFMRQIAEGVNHKRLRIMLNSDWRDTDAPGLEANLALVGDWLADRHHLHELDSEKFVEGRFYEIQAAFLFKRGWKGACMLEIKDHPADRLGRLEAMRRRWNEILGTL